MTSPAYHLHVDPDSKGTVHLRLLDAHGVQTGAHQVRLEDHRPALWEGLFDTRGHVRRYAKDSRGKDQILDALGVFLAATSCRNARSM